MKKISVIDANLLVGRAGVDAIRRGEGPIVAFPEGVKVGVRDETPDAFYVWGYERNDTDVARALKRIRG